MAVLRDDNLPVQFHPLSNGACAPWRSRGLTEEAIRRILETADANSRRLDMSRRTPIQTEREFLGPIDREQLRNRRSRTPSDRRTPLGNHPGPRAVPRSETARPRAATCSRTTVIRTTLSESQSARWNGPVGSSAAAHEGALALVLISTRALLIALLAMVFVVAIWLTIGCSIWRSFRENRRERAAPGSSSATKADL